MAERMCSVDGCDAISVGRGWCRMHYARWKRHGAPGPAGRYRRQYGQDAECIVTGCTQAPGKGGMCGRHYQRWRTKGHPDACTRAPAEDGWPECKVEGCIAVPVARGWCSMHWQRWRKTGDPGPAEPSRHRFRQPNGTICAAEGCTSMVRFSDKCRRHYQEDVHRRALLKRYGMTQDVYDRMVARQRNRCAICRRKRPASDGREWSIDHDHVTGQVRGLLCNDCNRAIGLLSDDPKILRAATQYVERHRQLQLVGPTVEMSRKAG